MHTHALVCIVRKKHNWQFLMHRQKNKRSSGQQVNTRPLSFDKLVEAAELGIHPTHLFRQCVQVALSADFLRYMFRQNAMTHELKMVLRQSIPILDPELLPLLEMGLKVFILNTFRKIIK